MARNIKYEYTIEGKTENGETVSSAGKSEMTMLTEEIDLADDGIVMREVAIGIIDHLYTFEIEKQGFYELSEIDLHIKLIR
jgi:hypothetical protein